MEYGIATSHDATQPRARGALLACGFWMRAAFVGASAVAVALVQLFEGEWSVPRALLCAVAGVAVAFLSWRRARAALDAMDEIDGAAATMLDATPAAAHR